MRMVAKSTMPALALAAGAVGFFSFAPTIVPPVTLAIGAAAATSATCRTLRWRLQGPIRLLLVGDRVAIAQAAARWERQRKSVLPVAGLLVEPDLDEAPAEIMGVPITTGLHAASAVAAACRADLVVVSPGPSFSHVDFRRLAWSLIGTRTTLGVMGVLDSVAPHRITPGTMHGATVHDVRLPRPSVLVEVVKSVIDRALGALLLVVSSPIILAMSAAVRLDSPGRAFFTQTRIGRDGRPFTVIKMRTMFENAEETKAQLIEANEYDDVLFKLKRDPRVTRVGNFLRRSSLDELPQLINVVRGEMSLVGPRPHLPTEIAEMDRDSLRRLAVRPGITGLWQVSGRSDLSWKDAVALDTYYADNWSLVGDASILVRTVKAVLGAKGAY
jgi:exopolysaccharide biosynthesis polyprenyl glycosylphosphotransferase